MAAKDEALKMAIKFMETLTIDVGIKTWNEKHRKEAIQACEEALEQPAQEPVAIVTGHIEISLLSDTINKMLPINTELYTHPAPSWQGLSDDEIEEALSGTDPNFIHGSCTQGILWAEAKLKEKNT